MNPVRIQAVPSGSSWFWLVPSGSDWIWWGIGKYWEDGFLLLKLTWNLLGMARWVILLKNLTQITLRMTQNDSK